MNPVQLRTLLRRRLAREEEATRELQVARAGREDAWGEHADAAAAAAAHERGRRGQEQALRGALSGQVQHSRRVLAVQHEVDRMAEEAVRLADVAAAAVRTLQQSEEMLAEARVLQAQRAREADKWRRALQRVEAARFHHAAAQAQAELEDELTDRHAHRLAGGPGMAAGA